MRARSRPIGACEGGRPEESTCMRSAIRIKHRAELSSDGRSGFTRSSRQAVSDSLPRAWRMMREAASIICALHLDPKGPKGPRGGSS
jgi:hypothetical protein